MNAFLGRLVDALQDFIRGILVNGIINNIEPAFEAFNDRIDAAGYLLIQTPDMYNPTIWEMIQNLAMGSIMPIAAIVLAFVLGYDFAQEYNKHNSMDDMDIDFLIKWFAKIIICLFFLAFIFDITNWIFSLGAIAVALATSVIQETTEAASPIEALIYQLENATNDQIGQLFGMFLMSFIVRLVMWVVNLAIYFILLSRFFMIYIKLSIAPIPFATFANPETSHIGKNYIKSIFAIAFQGFFMMVVLGIYGALMVSTMDLYNLDGLWDALGYPIIYSVIVVITLFKSESISKSIFGAT